MLKTLLEAIKTALQNDATIAAYCKAASTQIFCGQSGVVFDAYNFPCMVISPDSEAISHTKMPHVKQRDFVITVYAYTEAFGNESGLLGESTTIRGIADIGDDIETCLDNNKLGGIIYNAEVFQKVFPTPPQQWQQGLNEVRVSVRYQARG